MQFVANAPTLTSAQSLPSIGGAPAGINTFGVEVVSYTRGTQNAGCSVINDQGGTASAALGAPDDTTAGISPADQASASIGIGGSLTIRFAGPASGDGNPSTPDVWVWEVGNVAEAYSVYVSEDNSFYRFIGAADQSTFGSQGFDVDHAGFDQNSQIRYIRINSTATNTPAPNACYAPDNRAIAGPDIDAVGVVTRGLEARLELEKSSNITNPSSLIAGDEITYSFTVTNVGTVDLTNVTVTDLLPDLSAITPEFADIAAGSSEVFTATYQVKQEDIYAGEIANTAIATGTPVDCAICDQNPTDEDDYIIEIPVNPALDLDKDSDVPAEETIALGQVITYSFTVTNIGNVPLTDVTITDDTLPDLQWQVGPNVGDLDPGDSATAIATYVVTSDDVAAGQILNIATATGQVPPECVGCDPPEDESSTLVPPEPAAPGITLEKSANTTGPVVEGEIITYTFTVSNTGNIDLRGITVDDPMPGLSWIVGPTIAKVQAGDDVTLTARYTVTAADVASGSVVNSATLICSEDCGDLPPPSTVETPTGNPGIALVKSAEFVSELTTGDVITYTFVVTNIGDLPLTNVTVIDPQISDITPASVAELAPGAEAIFTGNYTVSSGDAAAGTFTNTAMATGQPPASCENCQPPADYDSENVPTVDPVPAISIVKESDVPADDTVGYGDEITYTFTVRNTGNVALTNVTVNDPLVDNVSPESVAELQPGASAQFTATYTVRGEDILAGSIENTATATGVPPTACQECEPPIDEDTVIVITVDPDPGVSLNKEADTAGPVAAGDIVTYEFTVTNTGNVPLTDITIVDPMPGLTWLGDGATIATLDVDEVVVRTATYTVTPDDVAAGVVANTATLECAGDCGDLPPPTTVEIPTADPGLSLTKEADTDGPVAAGDIITYTFTVTNTGNVPLEDVTINDPMPSLTWLGDGATIATLDVEEVVIRSATYTVTPDDLANGVVANTATVTCEGDCGELPPPTTVEIPTADPGVSLTKEADTAGPVAAGDVITYTFTVTNLGNVPLADITIVDPMPGLTWLGDGATIATLAVEEVVVRTATYTVTPDDVAAGVVANTATLECAGDCGELPLPPTIEIPTANPGVSLVKEADTAGPVAAGEVITYTFTVANLGNVPLVDVTINDPLPGLTWLGDGATIAFLDIDEVISRSATYTVTPDDVAAGSVLNTATLECTGDCGELPPPTTVEIPAADPGVSLTKEADTAGPVAAGDVITYTFTVANLGNVALTNVTIDDPLPGLTWLGDGPTIAYLAVEEVVVRTATYTVTPTDVAAGGVVNTASVACEGDCGELPPPSTVEVPATPLGLTRISLEKTVSPASTVREGETLTYTFTVTNIGEETVTDVVVNDPLPGLTWIDGPFIGTLEPGQSASVTATYLVTAVDAAAGRVANTATAVGYGPGGDPVTDEDSVRIRACAPVAMPSTVDAPMEEAGRVRAVQAELEPDSEPEAEPERERTRHPMATPVLPEPVEPEPVLPEEPVAPEEIQVEVECEPLPSEEPEPTDPPVPTDRPTTAPTARPSTGGGTVPGPGSPGGGSPGAGSPGSISSAEPLVTDLPSTGQASGTSRSALTGWLLGAATVALIAALCGAVISRRRSLT